MSAPSLFQWHYSDRALGIVAWSGAAIAALMLLGLPQAVSLPLTMLAWILLWALFLSIVNVGQTFFAFGWESLLLEAGFLAIFLGSDAYAPSALVILLYRWLAFRVEFGAGLIKMRGDRCWRDLTCLDYHHETQPMPNPLSWYFHRLPKRFHRLEVLGNHVAQLVVPFGLFLPQPVAAVAGAYMILTQVYLVVSGNYAWLNWITIVVAIAALPDSLLGVLLPFARSAVIAPPPLFTAGAVGLALLVGALSYQPVRNLLGRRQLMNYSFNSLHIVNTYGAFGSVTRHRDEVVVEGTDDPDPTDESPWREYEFKGKPGDPARRPPQVAPYHLRLDWLMWFLPLSPAYGEQWFLRFLEALLRDDPGLLGLLRANPFPGRPPLTVRARLYRYRYTTWSERRRSGAWWVRELMGDYVPAVSLRHAVES
ncbi:MAG: lipase maturation factor family protein [Chloroflexi bacterium]|nr:MAG: lipase maturation factor family protein [Chloroflexota bacterium]